LTVGAEEQGVQDVRGKERTSTPHIDQLLNHCCIVNIYREIDRRRQYRNRWRAACRLCDVDRQTCVRGLALPR